MNDAIFVTFNGISLLPNVDVERLLARVISKDFGHCSAKYGSAGSHHGSNKRAGQMIRQVANFLKEDL